MDDDSNSGRENVLIISLEKIARPFQVTKPQHKLERN